MDYLFSTECSELDDLGCSRGKVDYLFSIECAELDDLVAVLEVKWTICSV